MKANLLGILPACAPACAVLALTASCVAPPVKPAPAAAPAPAPVIVLAPTHPAPLPPPPKDWRDAPATPGLWHWRMEGNRSVARFGLAGQPALASLTCDKPADNVLIGRSGTGIGHVAMAISTTTGTRPLLSEPLASSATELVSVLRPGDPILDAIAYSRGRFALEVQGFPPLYLPSWPELSRVIEDCR